MTTIAPWQWAICDTSPQARVHAAGIQHTNLYAAADTIAAERLTVHAYNHMLAGNPHPQNLICRVRRAGNPTWEGYASTDRLCLPTPDRRPA